MKTAYSLVLPVLTLAGTSLAAEFPPGPDLGQSAGAAEIVAWDTDVMPDGEGLPPGGGNAVRGRKIYERHCLSCHGKDGLGDSGDQLAGAKMGLTDDWPEKTIGNYWPYAPTLFDFIRRSMPMQAPWSLSDDEVYAVTAYLFYLNGISRETDVMDAETLRIIKMPNRNGFIDGYNEQ